MWLNSFYKTDNVLDGDDIVDHKAIHPVIGDRAIFDRIKKTMRKKGTINSELLISGSIL